MAYGPGRTGIAWDSPDAAVRTSRSPTKDHTDSLSIRDLVPRSHVKLTEL